MSATYPHEKLFEDTKHFLGVGGDLGLDYKSPPRFHINDHYQSSF